MRRGYFFFGICDKLFLDMDLYIKKTSIGPVTMVLACYQFLTPTPSKTPNNSHNHKVVQARFGMITRTGRHIALGN